MAQAAVDWFGAEWGGSDVARDNDAARDSDAWRGAHEALLRLAERRAGLDFEEGRWLLAALRAGTHVRLGYGSFHEYAERLFGYGPRVTQEKLRVAEALEELPDMARELEAGRVSFSAVRELTRVATPKTEREWLEAARGRTVRELEQLVSGHRPGSLPSDAPEASAKRHVLRFEVSGEVLATFREAMAKIRRDAGESLNDDAAILLLARSVLGGSRDEGRSSYQVALTICECCGRGGQLGRGELVGVASEVVEMATCDGQNIGPVPDAHVGGGAKMPSGTKIQPPNRPRAIQDSIDAEGGARIGTGRATQTIPPALRRAVLRRDGARCTVPGCRHATFVDVHHLLPRSEGGDNTSENLVTLCSAHHRAIHRGELHIEGTPSTGLRFLHADGTVYGGSPSPASVDARAKACRALELMGYRPSEVKRALIRLPDSRDAGLEHIIRRTLHQLTANKLG
jgi:5-methylcytosine-specific restriction endonuclease McrA